MMSLRGDIENVLTACLPDAPPKYIRWGSRFLIEVATGDWAWIDFADPMTALTHPLLFGNSGSWKSFVIRTVGRIVREAFPGTEIPALMTREATITHLSKKSIPHGKDMPLGFFMLPELGLLFESNDATYNKGRRDFLMELLEGHVIGKGTTGDVINEFPVHCPSISATTPQRLHTIIPSRLDMTDGLPVRFSPVVSMEKGSDDMPPVIQPSIFIPVIKMLQDLRKDLKNSGGLRMVHTTQSMPYYEKLVADGRRDLKKLRMHPASFGRAKMNFSRICISEEVSNFGVTSTSISDVSARVAYEDSLQSARDMFGLLMLMGPTEDMRLILDLVVQSHPAGISKTVLRKTAGIPTKRYAEAFASLSGGDGCGLVRVEKKIVKTKPVQLVKLA